MALPFVLTRKSDAWLPPQVFQGAAVSDSMGAELGRWVYVVPSWGLASGPELRRCLRARYVHLSNQGGTGSVVALYAYMRPQL